MHSNVLVLTLTDSNVNNIISNHPIVLVDFWAPWCGPCVKLGPTIEQLANLYQGKAIIGKLNIDDYAETSVAYTIKSIPTLLIFHQGNVVERLVGNLPIEKIKEALDRYITS